MSWLGTRVRSAATSLIDSRFDTTFRLPDGEERLRFAIPASLCTRCHQLYLDPDLIDLAGHPGGSLRVRHRDRSRGPGARSTHPRRAPSPSSPTARRGRDPHRMLRDPELQTQRVHRIVHVHRGARQADALAAQVQLHQATERPTSAPAVHVAACSDSFWARNGCSSSLDQLRRSCAGVQVLPHQ